MRVQAGLRVSLRGPHHLLRRAAPGGRVHQHGQGPGDALRHAQVPAGLGHQVRPGPGHHPGVHLRLGLRNPDDETPMIRSVTPKLQPDLTMSSFSPEANSIDKVTSVKQITKPVTSDYTLRTSKKFFNRQN